MTTIAEIALRGGGLFVVTVCKNHAVAWVSMRVTRPNHSPVEIALDAADLGRFKAIIERAERVASLAAADRPPAVERTKTANAVRQQRWRSRHSNASNAPPVTPRPT